MAFETTYTSLRENLAAVLDRVADDHEVVLVRRKGQRDVALVPAAEFAGLMETAHLLRSPRNARRLLTALHRAERRIVGRALTQCRSCAGKFPSSSERHASARLTPGGVAWARSVNVPKG